MPVLKPEHPRDPDFQAALRDLAPDCCPVVAYGALVPQSALDIPAHGWVNLHFSLLPAWRGAAPVQHAIWAGDEVTGATTFRLVRSSTPGPTYGVITERSGPTTPPATCSARLAEGGAGLLVATLDAIEDGTLEARAAAGGRRQLAPKITVDDAARRLDRAGPGGRPPDPRLHPGAGRLDHARGRAGQARPGVGDAERRAPRARGASRCAKNAVLVGTATHAGPARRVKAFGKKQMAAADWARGVRFARRGHAGDMTAPETVRPATPDDVDTICVGLPETWLGTSWGVSPRGVPLNVQWRPRRQGARVPAVPPAAQVRR